MKIRTEYIQHLQTSFEGFRQRTTTDLNALVSENLLSPFKVTLPREVLEQAQSAIRTLFLLRERQNYQSFYAAELSRLGLSDPGNKSIAMSYDFHVDENNKLKLIEVNTNAAFLAMGFEMYQVAQVPLPVSDFSRDEIRQNIQNELRLQCRMPQSNLRITTTDDHPEQQRLFVEFLLYHEYFKSWGWDSSIRDIRDLDLANTDFVYNRHTDFLLDTPVSQSLKDAFNKKTVCVSPNPFEYFLLADKQRLIDWSNVNNHKSWAISESAQQLLKSVIPQSMDINRASFEDIWSQRKRFFFKPKRAFGSKSSYKGASISRRAYEEFQDKEFIAQEYIPASEKTFETPTGPQNFKYDLRCYAYQDRMQLVVARLYQGQVTNLRTPLGGFACVEFL